MLIGVIETGEESAFQNSDKKTTKSCGSEPLYRIRIRYCTYIIYQEFSKQNKKYTMLILLKILVRSPLCTDRKIQENLRELVYLQYASYIFESFQPEMEQTWHAPSSPRNAFRKKKHYFAPGTHFKVFPKVFIYLPMFRRGPNTICTSVQSYQLLRKYFPDATKN